VAPKEVGKRGDAGARPDSVWLRAPSEAERILACFVWLAGSTFLVEKRPPTGCGATQVSALHRAGAFGAVGENHRGQRRRSTRGAFTPCVDGGRAVSVHLGKRAEFKLPAGDEPEPG